MLLKLIKFDTKSSIKKFTGVFSVFIVLCIITPLVMAAVNMTASLVYSVFVLCLGISAIYIISIVFICQHYNGNFYGNEGYLMFTLPTSGKKLLLSKVITAFIWMLITMILMMSAIYTAFSVLGRDSDFAGEFSKIFGYMDFNSTNWAVIGVEYVIGSIQLIIEIFFSITISKLPVWRKCGTLMGFVVFFLISLLEAVPAMFTSNTSQLIKKSIASETDVQLSMHFDFASYYSWSNGWVAIVVGLVFIVALFIGTTLLLDKKNSIK